MGGGWAARPTFSRSVRRGAVPSYSGIRADIPGGPRGRRARRWFRHCSETPGAGCAGTAAAPNDRGQPVGARVSDGTDSKISFGFCIQVLDSESGVQRQCLIRLAHSIGPFVRPIRLAHSFGSSVRRTRPAHASGPPDDAKPMQTEVHDERGSSRRTAHGWSGGAAQAPGRSASRRGKGGSPRNGRRSIPPTGRRRRSADPPPAALDVLERIGLSEAIPSCIEAVTAGRRTAHLGRPSPVSPIPGRRHGRAGGPRLRAARTGPAPRSRSLRGPRVLRDRGRRRAHGRPEDAGIPRVQAVRPSTTSPASSTRSSTFTSSSGQSSVATWKDPRDLDLNTCYAAIAGNVEARRIELGAAGARGRVARHAAHGRGRGGALAGTPVRQHVKLFRGGRRCGSRRTHAGCLEAAVRGGMPILLLAAGQAGATSPAALGGAVVQEMAEVLAGLVYVNALSPGHPAILGPWPFVSDLRTGAMSGGSGEQAVLMAACGQMGRFYDLPTGIRRRHGRFKAHPTPRVAARRDTRRRWRGIPARTSCTSRRGCWRACSVRAWRASSIDNDTLGSIKPVRARGRRRRREPLRGDHARGVHRGSEALPRASADPGTDAARVRISGGRRPHEPEGVVSSRDRRKSSSVRPRRVRETLSRHFPRPHSGGDRCHAAVEFPDTACARAPNGRVAPPRRVVTRAVTRPGGGQVGRDSPRGSDRRLAVVQRSPPSVIARMHVAMTAIPTSAWGFGSGARFRRD